MLYRSRPISHAHVDLLERIYFLFGRDSKCLPGRMSADAEAALVDMLWRWAGPRCRLEMTIPERDWWVWGSENHHAQAWAGFWGAAQVFSRRADFKDRRYADGTTPSQMAAAETPGPDAAFASAPGREVVGQLCWSFLLWPAANSNFRSRNASIRGAM